MSYLEDVEVAIHADMSNLTAAVKQANESAAALLEALAPDGRLPELYAGGLA